MLLLHTTCMADSDEEVLELLDGFEDGPLAGRELGHVKSPTTVAEENVAQTAQNPEGHRYAVDCAWTDASADVLAPLLLDIWRGLDTEHSFSIWYGWAPPRPLPDMAFSVEGNVYVATYLIYTDPADDESYRARVHEQTAAIARDGGVGVYLGDTDFTRRTGPLPVRRELPPAGADPGGPRPGRPLRVVPRVGPRAAECPCLTGLSPARPRRAQRRRPRRGGRVVRRGVRLRARVHGPAGAFELDIVMLIHPERGDRLELLHRPGSRPGLRAADPPQPCRTEGFGHVAFDVDGVDAAFDRLVALGARPVMTPRPSPEPGVRMAFVADPEGNLVELLDRSGVAS